jgi:hypothetical protein
VRKRGGERRALSDDPRVVGARNLESDLSDELRTLYTTAALPRLRREPITSFADRR